MATVSLSRAREELIAAGITGTHRSHSRSGNLGKIRALTEGDEDAAFGLTGLEKYTPEDILGFMAELTGCVHDMNCIDIEDEIDPERTMQGIVTAAERLRDHAAVGGTLLSATGHPTGMLEHYIRVMDAFMDAGGKVLRLREGDKLPIGSRGQDREVRYVGNVGCLADWGALKHSHSSKAMEALLEAQPWPDLVLADHGFAGAAIERRIPTIAIMDINDHALAVAAAEGRDVTIVPLDDNRPPRLYEPSWRIFEHVIGGGTL